MKPIHSVGIYNDSEATEYCMEIRQVTFSGPIFGGEQEKKYIHTYTVTLLLIMTRYYHIILLAETWKILQERT